MLLYGGAARIPRPWLLYMGAISQFVDPELGILPSPEPEPAVVRAPC